MSAFMIKFNFEEGETVSSAYASNEYIFSEIYAIDSGITGFEKKPYEGKFFFYLGSPDKNPDQIRQVLHSDGTPFSFKTFRNGVALLPSLIGIPHKYNSCFLVAENPIKTEEGKGISVYFYAGNDTQGHTNEKI